jgi:protein SERAC1
MVMHPVASLHNVYLSTKGIMFMGVPHLGSHLAKWGSILRKLIPEPFRSTNGKALDALKTDSELCHELDHKFQREAKHGKLRNIKLFSFYETKPIAGMTNPVVPEKSAILKGDPSLPIQGDHRSMTRFSGPDDPEYCKVKGQLLSWLSATDIPVDDAIQNYDQILPKGPRIQMQGATFSGNITGTVNAGQQ